jgi:uncharacterized membrane protein YkvA (DUF1232 family)
MKLTRIRNKLHRHTEKQALKGTAPRMNVEEQQIEHKLELSSDDTTINNDTVNQKSQVNFKNISSQIQDDALAESVRFWQVYLLKWALKSDSYSLMKSLFYQINKSRNFPRNKLVNRSLKVFKFAFNRRNWQRIKNIQAKYRNFVEWSREPESVWFSLILVLGLYCYFILPEDFLSDFFPIIGFIDDFIAIIFVSIWLAFELNENILQLSKSEARKYIFILELIFSFGIAGLVSAVSVKFLIQFWEFMLVSLAG